MSPDELLVIVPSRGRPTSLPALAQSFVDTGAKAQLLVAVDEDDPALQDYEAHAEKLERVDLRVGARMRLAGTLNHYATREAHRYRAIGFLGDDNRPRTQGWDQRLCDALDELGTGVAYGNDLLQGEAMPTAVALTSDIVEALGYMCPPGFVHLCLDLVWLEWGRGLDAIRYLDDVIIEHLHPANGKAPWDDTYADGNSAERNMSDSARFYDYRDNGELAADLATLRRLQW